MVSVEVGDGDSGVKSKWKVSLERKKKERKEGRKKEQFKENRKKEQIFNPKTRIRICKSVITGCFFFFFFSDKVKLGISYELSATVHMKFQALFSLKKLEFSMQHLSLTL